MTATHTDEDGTTCGECDGFTFTDDAGNCAECGDSKL